MSLTDGTYNPLTVSPVVRDSGYWVSDYGHGFTYWTGSSRVDHLTRGVFEIARRTGGHVGVWSDTETGITHVDVSRFYCERDTAIDAGFNNAQLSIWDIANAVAIDVTRPLATIDSVTISSRVDGVRGHVVACVVDGVIGTRVTAEPACKLFRSHLAAHGIETDVWTVDGAIREYVESATGDFLTVRRDTVSFPNSFGWAWSRVSSDGDILQSGTAGNETAACVLARMSNR